MKIDRLIDDYDSLILQQELDTLIKKGSIKLKLKAEVPMDHLALLSIPFSYLFYEISKGSVEDGSYIRGLEAEQLPYIPEIMNFHFNASVNEDMSEPFVEKGNPTEWSSDKNYEFVYLECFFSVKNKWTIDKYFSQFNIRSMAENVLKRSVEKVHGYKGNEIDPFDRHNRISFNYEDKTYRFSDYGLKSFEDICFLYRFMFSTRTDEEIFEWMKNRDKTRVVLSEKESIINIFFKNRNLQSYGSTFQLI